MKNLEIELNICSTIEPPAAAAVWRKFSHRCRAINVIKLRLKALYH